MSKTMADRQNRGDDDKRENSLHVVGTGRSDCTENYGKPRAKGGTLV